MSMSFMLKDGRVWVRFAAGHLCPLRRLCLLAHPLEAHLFEAICRIFSSTMARLWARSAELT
jgi:hypothetical protein